MKKLILVFTLLSCSSLFFGQNKEGVNLIQSDGSLGKEIVKISFWFAPEINYKGYEDIRLAKGWEEINSNGFCLGYEFKHQTYN